MEDRLRSLGRHLLEIGSLAPSGFIEVIRLLMLQHASARTAHEENLLRLYGEEPEYWAAELRRNIEARLAAAVKADYVVPVDLPESLPREERLIQARNLIRQYAQLLICWPDIVNRAKALAEADQRTTSRIA
jgi:hypothetical protein